MNRPDFNKLVNDLQYTRSHQGLCEFVQKYWSATPWDALEEDEITEIASALQAADVEGCVVCDVQLTQALPNGEDIANFLKALGKQRSRMISVFYRDHNPTDEEVEQIGDTMNLDISMLQQRNIENKKEQMN